MSQYVLEWSQRSNNFHVQPLETTLAKNQECFLSDRSHDWIVLMVGSHDVVTRMADNHRERLIGRQKKSTIVTMHAAALSKLTTTERNHLIDQVGAIELVE